MGGNNYSTGAKVEPFINIELNADEIAWLHVVIDSVCYDSRFSKKELEIQRGVKAKLREGQKKMPEGVSK